jgi:branched-chain amino acid transport system ATP-binding protein
LLEVKDISIKFGGLIALKNVSFRINEGEIIGLIGPNGAGKTTLVNVITGVIKPDSGRIFFNRNDITRYKPNKVCQEGIARTFQVAQPFQNLSILQNVEIGNIFGKISKRTKRSEIECKEVLNYVGLKTEYSRMASSLNVIEIKKLDLARALATDPKLLILDELNTGLNPSESKEAINLIQKIRENGKSILIVEHLMKIIMELCDRIVVLDFGEKIGEGTPREVSSNQKVIQAYLGES